MADFLRARYLNLVTVPILVLALSAVAHAGELVYVQSKQAKLLSIPAFDGALVATVEKGAALEKLALQGRWVKVSHGDQQGWVSQLLVGPRPPLARESVIDDGAADLKQNARRRASATASTAAARGLRNDDRARQSDDSVADYSALTEMEGFAVSDDEANKFLEQGMQ
ncbi:MAG: hypothetical protein FD165_1866 [Gammaproteobacteria bacterium]|nr:MAG: hypothetical protein FD165_1866 [Gammaproteobacteria bacterium]TND04439.1 MAG: hypothetical protein FD120_1553 [Gammaproteobacteria bacterium]